MNISNMNKTELSNILKRLENINDSIRNDFFKDKKNAVLWLKILIIKVEYTNTYKCSR